MAPWLLLIVLVACQSDDPVEDPIEPPSSPEIPWTPLFDGKSIEGWKITEFGGDGEVWVEDGRIIMDFGSPLTGITYQGEPPKMNYELSLLASRVSGTDFFCGLTFPVGDSHASLILGGWGGSLCGISCLDGMDAASNETTTYQSFRAGETYAVRVVVAESGIQAWLDDEKIADAPIANREVSLRNEVLLSRPLGVACFATRAAAWDIKWRPLEEGAPSERDS